MKKRLYLANLRNVHFCGLIYESREKWPENVHRPLKKSRKRIREFDWIFVHITIHCIPRGGGNIPGENICPCNYLLSPLHYVYHGQFLSSSFPWLSSSLSFPPLPVWKKFASPVFANSFPGRWRKTCGKLQQSFRAFFIDDFVRAFFGNFVSSLHEFWFHVVFATNPFLSKHRERQSKKHIVPPLLIWTVIWMIWLMN